MWLATEKALLKHAYKRSLIYTTLRIINQNYLELKCLALLFFAGGGVRVVENFLTYFSYQELTS